jgi:hypothetical protein
MRILGADFVQATSRQVRLAVPGHHLPGTAWRVLTLLLAGLTVGLLAPAADAANAGLQMSIASPASAGGLAVGDDVTFFITAKNNGPAAIPAGIASIIAWVPARSTFVRFTTPSGWNCSSNTGLSLPPVGSTGGIMTCVDANAFNAGSRGVFTLTAHLTSAGNGTTFGQAAEVSGGFVSGIVDLGISTCNVPTVSSITPNSGPATSDGGFTFVTVTGTGFKCTDNITIGGTPMAAWTVASDTTITGIPQNHVPGLAAVVVTTSGGTPSGFNSLYTYLARP